MAAESEALCCCATRVANEECSSLVGQWKLVVDA